MDIRAPTHELIRAHAVPRTRRRIADGKPDWALSAAGLAGLRGRGGRGESDENTGTRNEEGDEAPSIDDGDDEADAAEPCEVPPTDDRLADVGRGDQDGREASIRMREFRRARDAGRV
jgi:hypothetical protein